LLVSTGEQTEDGLLAEGQDRAASIGVAADPGPVAVGMFLVVLVAEPERLAIGRGQHHFAAGDGVERVLLAQGDRMVVVGTRLAALACTAVGQQLATIGQRGKTGAARRPPG